LVRLATLLRSLAAATPHIEERSLVLEVDDLLHVQADEAHLSSFLRALLDHAVACSDADGRVILRLFSQKEGVMLEVQTQPSLRCGAGNRTRIIELLSKIVEASAYSRNDAGGHTFGVMFPALSPEMRAAR
jgi:hypothetical protein